MLSKKQKKLIKELFYGFFHMTLSDGQCEIAGEIIYKIHKRNQIITPTQYGKSLVVGGAIAIDMLINEEDWIIISTSTDKASIIMGYVIDFISKNDLFYDQLDIDYKDITERLQTQRSKKSITFKDGGSVSILSVDTKNSKRNVEAAMGKGGKNLVLDESALVDDVLYATIKRMLGGYGKDAFLLEIGNPFHRNHFHRTWHSKRYNKIFIDYHQALAEGRFTEEFIAEMKEEALFDILYECRFPDEEEIDQKGYRQLLTLEDIANAQEEIEHVGNKSLGADIGGGGDYNVYTVRSQSYAEIVGSNRSSDTMVNVTEIENKMSDYGIEADSVSIDDVGIGRGVTDRLKEKMLYVNAVSAGSSPQDKTKFANVKAENYWALRDWIKGGGKLKPHDKWIELTWIKYKVTSDKVIQIQSKDELKKEKGKSPDFAESLMLTFTPPNTVQVYESGYIY